MAMVPFVTDLINDLLVSRRVFSGLFIFGGAKRYVNIINRFNINVKVSRLAQQTVVKFMADVSALHVKFLALLKAGLVPSVVIV